eukprot:620866-Rhodomonas_salina.1
MEVLIPFRSPSCEHLVFFNSITPREFDDNYSRGCPRGRIGVSDDHAIRYKVPQFVRAVRPER